MPHRNANDNDDLHHLYGIWDKKEDDLFKYGISDDPIEEDGLCDRVREQVYLLNLAVGWIRYVGWIIMTGLRGRKHAKDLENEHSNAYKEQHGQRPRGNPLRRKSKFSRHLKIKKHICSKTCSIKRRIKTMGGCRTGFGTTPETVCHCKKEGSLTILWFSPRQTFDVNSADG